MLARGLRIEEIAASMHLGEPTVRTHAGHICAKLGARDRAQAVVLATRPGWCEPGTSPAEALGARFIHHRRDNSAQRPRPNHTVRSETQRIRGRAITLQGGRAGPPNDPHGGAHRRPGSER
jgi:hypothetical protein